MPRARTNHFPRHLLRDPWGTPAQRTIYPSNFPPKIRQLIGMIPLQRGRIGPNIRPMIVDIVWLTFSTPELADIAAVLSLAPLSLLRAIAQTIADLLNTCCTSEPGIQLTLQEFWSTKLEGRTSTPLTFFDIEEILNWGTAIVMSPDLDVPFSIVVLPRNAARRAEHGARTPQMVREFIASLEVVPVDLLEVGDRCGICLEGYGGSPQLPEGSDKPLRLRCGHVFGQDCLAILLMPTGVPGPQHSSCPMCRAPLDMVRGDEEPNDPRASVPSFYAIG